jgi:alkaline phosphatase
MRAAPRTRNIREKGMRDEARDCDVDTPPAPDRCPATARNVIFLVADGFGSAAAGAYRAFQGGAPPLWEEGAQALVRTGSADNPVTDSAAAATAYATGVKTYNGGVGVDPDGMALPSLIDLAEDAGKTTGIVSTAAITDATPAAFAANALDRDDEAGIAQQYVDLGQLDLMLGGGRASFAADADGDGISTLDEAVAAGFTTVSTAEEMAAATGERLLGLFGDGSLSAPIGNGAFGERAQGEPTLAAMTEVALSRLSDDPDGFFLLVEEEATDDAGHANDAASMMAAARSYEDALRVALDFAAENPDTLVISVADHETGGMTLEFDPPRTPAIYAGFTAGYAEILAAMQAAAFPTDADPALVLAGVNATVADLTGGAVALTGAELAAILAAAPADASRLLASMLNDRGGVEFSTTNHTAADVMLSAWGAGAGLRGGVIENTEVAAWVAEAAGLSFPGPEVPETAPVTAMESDLLFV